MYELNFLKHRQVTIKLEKTQWLINITDKHGQLIQ